MIKRKVISAHLNEPERTIQDLSGQVLMVPESELDRQATIRPLIEIEREPEPEQLRLQLPAAQG